MARKNFGLVLKNNSSILICVLIVLFAQISLINGHGKKRQHEQDVIRLRDSSDDYWPNDYSDQERLCNSIDEFNKIKRDIWSSRSKLNPMFDMVLQPSGSEHHSTYNELALFVDTFGPRISGSDSLEYAIDYMVNKAKLESKLDNVHTEDAMIPKWVRGKEWARLHVNSDKNKAKSTLHDAYQVAPHDMMIMGLGSSVGTKNTVLRAPVLLVNSFDELAALGGRGLVSGKIVVYNVKFTTYGATVAYRSQGATRASRYGAVGALVRSITPTSIYSPHAGKQTYDTDVNPIPVAAITLEDADLISRWVSRNRSLTIELYMEAENYPDVPSRNIIAELSPPSSTSQDVRNGAEKVEKEDKLRLLMAASIDLKDKQLDNNSINEIVLISGHMDSWDVTQGAMDDGGGMMISFKALDLLKKANLRPNKRTIRALLWTSEEFGYVGAQQYLKDHRGELDKFSVVMESDLGTFSPQGLSMSGSTKLGKCIVREIAKTLSQLNATQFDLQFEGSDIELFTELGVPGVSLKNENSRYFDYHHTRGDSMSVENPDELDRAALVWASAAFILADVDIKLPRPNSTAVQSSAIDVVSSARSAKQQIDLNLKIPAPAPAPAPALAPYADTHLYNSLRHSNPGTTSRNQDSSSQLFKDYDVESPLLPPYDLAQ